MSLSMVALTFCARPLRVPLPAPAPLPEVDFAKAATERDRAKQAEQAGDVDGARLHLEAALEAAPGWSEPELDLAELLLSRGEEPDRVAAMLATAEPDPKEATRLWRLRGILAEQDGDRAAAVRTYQSALACDPADTFVHARLAHLFLAGGDTDAAISEFEWLQERSPLDATLHAALADAYVRVKRFEDAQQQLAAAVTLDPSNPIFHRRLANVYDQQGLRKKAAAEHAQADALTTATTTRKMRPLPPSKR